MSTDLVLHSTEEAFSLAERISRSALVPQAYRGKPADAAIAMLYGAEMGMPPMSSLQRIVVINGKPSMDAQGMVAMIRQAGHSVSGSVSIDGAKITGKRGDNGDEMTVEWGPDDAKRAGLNSQTYSKFPSDMYWARAVSQLGRRLFADVLLGVSYVPEEAAAIPTNGNGNGSHAAQDPAPAPQIDRASTLRPPPGTPAADQETGEIIDAEVVEDAPPAKKSQKDNLHRLFGLKGITDRDARLAYCIHVIEREIDSSNELTEPEADKLIAQLKAEVGEEPPLQDVAP